MPRPTYQEKLAALNAQAWQLRLSRSECKPARFWWSWLLGLKLPPRVFLPQTWGLGRTIWLYTALMTVDLCVFLATGYALCRLLLPRDLGELLELVGWLFLSEAGSLGNILFGLFLWSFFTALVTSTLIVLMWRRSARRAGLPSWESYEPSPD